jgi:hypothetical protein
MRKIVRTAILFFSLFFIGLLTDVLSHPAWGIVVDANRQIYFSDLETIYKIDSQGKLSIFRAGVSGRHIHDLTIDVSGNLYGWDNSYEPLTQKHLRAFWKMSPGGEYTEIVPLTENLPTGMSIWRDLEGNMYAAEPWNNEKRESKIIKRALDGKTTLFAGGNYGYLDGEKQKAKFGIILDMAFAKDNSIYLTDSNRVRKLDKFGIVKTIYPDKVEEKHQKRSETASQLFGLDVSEQNDVFAADFANSRLLKISSDGKVSTFFNSEKDWSPIGVATFGDEVYVLEGRPYSASTHNGTRVLKISLLGKSTVIANLEDKNKSIENPKSDSVNLLSQNEEKMNLAVNADMSGIKTSADTLGFYGILGAVSVAFFALIILFRRK